MKIKSPAKGFTILEIIIAISVILILAAVALTNAGGIIQGMRFTNAFNKTFLMVQKARNLAMAGKETQIEKYGVVFFINTQPKNTAALFLYEKNAAKPTGIETFSIASTSNIEINVSDEDGAACGNLAEISFKNGSAATELMCDDGNGENFLSITLKENTVGGRAKTFSINKIGGLPQIEK